MAGNGAPVRRDMRPPWRAGVRLPAWISVNFVVKAVAVVALGLLSYRGIKERTETATRTNATLQRLRELDSFLSALKDAETGERGYLITGDERYLEPYEAASAAIPSKLSTLRASVLDSPELRDQVAERLRVHWVPPFDSSVCEKTVL